MDWLSILVFVYLAVGIWCAVSAYFLKPEIHPAVRVFWLALFVPVWPLAFAQAYRQR
jgi:hypothetical protein